MAGFLEAMVFVFGGVLAIALLVAAIFAMLATPKKGQPLEDKHKAAKKKSNICALIAGGSILLGVGCAILNNVIIQNERKGMIDNQLFNDNGKAEINSKPFTSSSRIAQSSSNPLALNSSDQQTSDSSNDSTASSTYAQKLDYMKDCSEKLTNGETLTPSQISLLRSTVDDVLIQLIASISRNADGALDGLSSAAGSLDTDTLTSLSSGLSGFAAKTVESYIESHKVITNYLTKLENSDTVTTEETAQCANELAYLTEMARIDLD